MATRVLQEYWTLAAETNPPEKGGLAPATNEGRPKGAGRPNQEGKIRERRGDRERTRS